MLADIARGRIGETKCDDGTTVDEVMWCAYQLADLLAKNAAETVAHPRSVIRQATQVAVIWGIGTSMRTRTKRRLVSRGGGG